MVWSLSVWRHWSWLRRQRRAVLSSEHDASTVRVGSHSTALTSFVCPMRCRTGSVRPSSYAKIVLSELHDTKLVSSRHATSSTAAVWFVNCCATSPRSASHTMLDRSTPPVSRCRPLGLHCSENTVPLCRFSTRCSSPRALQIRATPSDPDVASHLSSGCQHMCISV